MFKGYWWPLGIWVRERDLKTDEGIRSVIRIAAHEIQHAIGYVCTTGNVGVNPNDETPPFIY